MLIFLSCPPILPVNPKLRIPDPNHAQHVKTVHHGNGDLCLANPAYHPDKAIGLCTLLCMGTQIHSWGQALGHCVHTWTCEQPLWSHDRRQQVPGWSLSFEQWRVCQDPGLLSDSASHSSGAAQVLHCTNAPVLSQ